MALTEVNASKMIADVSDDSKPAEEQGAETRELTINDLGTLDAMLELGRQAASVLQSFGAAAFLVDESGCVRLANPMMVFFDHRIGHAPEGVEPVFVRPILTRGRPQYVAKKPDGSLWEVEYPQRLPVDETEEEET